MHPTFVGLALILATTHGYGSARKFSILHTNDWQSRLLPFGPDTPSSRERKIGGVARLATLIGERRSAIQAPTVLLDAGDFTMGTLFHTVSRETGTELQLLHRLGYDAACLGNHEFDFGVTGLTAMIRSALASPYPPPALVSANLRFRPGEKGDDELERLWQEGIIRPYTVVKREGLTFGIFGLLGQEAAEVAPNTKPVEFTPPVEAAKHWAAFLRREEKVDVVIAVSHSGVHRNDEGEWAGEEVEIARAVPEIDVIVGGHSHTPMPDPIIVGGMPIVQAGSDVQYLGELAMVEKAGGGWQMASYTLHPVDHNTEPDPAIQRALADVQTKIENEVLATMGYGFAQPLAEIAETRRRDFRDRVIGNLVAESIREATDAAVGFVPHGSLRADLYSGTTGVQTTADLYRILPLGVGLLDSSPGYPLIKMHFTPKELKGIGEALIEANKERQDDYHPYFAGMRIRFNELRTPLDRVSDIFLRGDDGQEVALDLSDDETLIAVGCTSYVGSFLWIIPKMSHGLISISPKDATGAPLTDLESALVDRDEEAPGVQEYKGWQALLDHVRRLEDVDGDGLPDIPLDAVANQARFQAYSSLRPGDLYRNAGWIQWTASLLVLLALLLVLRLGWAVTRRIFGGGAATLPQPSFSGKGR